MLSRLYVLALLPAVAFAQTAKPATSSQTQGVKAPTHSAASSKSSTASNPTVVIIQGMCATPAKKTGATEAACKTTISKSEFEKMVNAIQPEMPASQQRQFADRYAMALVMAHDAHEKGLDRGPQFEEMMKLMRIQVLAQAMAKNVREQASKVSESDEENYYKTNAANYQEADLERIYIPLAKQVTPKQGEKPEDIKKERDASEADMKKEAESLHTRAAAGEDFNKLQSDAFDAAGMKVASPNTKVSKVREGSFPVEQRSIFSLKDGGVSQLITTPGGYLIYKVDSKTTLPFSTVKEEIHNMLQNQNSQKAMQAIEQSVKLSFDEDYFKTPSPTQNAMRVPTAPGAVTAQPR
jgi:hypothetical protein